MRLDEKDQGAGRPPPGCDPDGPLPEPLRNGNSGSGTVDSAQRLLLRWSTLILARLDAVVEQHAAGGPSTAASVLDAIADAARERRDHVARLLPFLDHPSLQPAWRRHCKHVSLAAGRDITRELEARLWEAVQGGGDRVPEEEERRSALSVAAARNVATDFPGAGASGRRAPRGA